MHENLNRPFDRLAKFEPEPEPMLTGEFLISPVGWFPSDAPYLAVSASFASLRHPDGDPMVYGLDDGVLLFSTN